MNQLGIDVLSSCTIVNSSGQTVPQYVYRLTFNYCIGGYSLSANDVALNTILWYYQLNQDLQVVYTDGISSTNPLPTYPGSTMFYTNFYNCYITVMSESLSKPSIGMSNYTCGGDGTNCYNLSAQYCSGDFNPNCIQPWC
jgi:hypothetical protein